MAQQNVGNYHQIEVRHLEDLAAEVNDTETRIRDFNTSIGGRYAAQFETQIKQKLNTLRQICSTFALSGEND